MWSHDGIICTGETYKNVVKLTFAKGASLEDPSGLFNSSLEGNTRRAIDFHEGDKIDEKAFKALDPRRRGTEHVGESDRSPGPLSEEAQDRSVMSEPRELVEHFFRHRSVGSCPC